MTTIRSAFAQTIANKIARPGAGPVDGESIRPTLEQAVQNFPTKADDQVEVNFERVSKAIASNDMQEAVALQKEAPQAIEAFGNLFLFGYGSQHNHSFESYGDGMFSIKGGNMAQRDVTFMVDTSPGLDGIQWMVLDNTKLPK